MASMQPVDKTKSAAVLSRGTKCLVLRRYWRGVLGAISAIRINAINRVLGKKRYTVCFETGGMVSSGELLVECAPA